MTGFANLSSLPLCSVFKFLKSCAIFGNVEISDDEVLVDLTAI